MSIKENTIKKGIVEGLGKNEKLHHCSAFKSNNFIGHTLMLISHILFQK